MTPEIHTLSSPRWVDYELLDSGNGQKLERFGSFRFVRPEVQALWSPGLPAEGWKSAHAVFKPSGEESGGHWEFNQKIPEQWEMQYPLQSSRPLRFSVMPTPGRHLGVFPECAATWDWIAEKISQTSGKRSVNVLNLFGYTGLASLAAASAGAKVTHVDASKKSVSWARLNQTLSGLEEKPIRWIVDDALKFVQREARREVRYDGILLDPPKFGRGPKGEVWEVYKALPELLQACKNILNERPLFIVLTIYAVKLPALNLFYSLQEMMQAYQGGLECGELVTRESSRGRELSMAVYARWNANE